MKLLSILVFAASLILGNVASAQTICNDPSGFLKSFGPISLNDLLILGPDCQHVQDGGNASAGGSGFGVVPTQSVVTISIAAPAVVNWPGYNLSLGTTVIFSTTGALPTGLTAIPVNSNPVPVYIIPIDGNNFEVATTLQNALAGIPLTTTGTQSGIQTAFANAVPCAGCVGETIWAVVPSGSGPTLNGPGVNSVWNAITLTPGIWEVRAQSGIIGGSAATAMASDYGFGKVAVTTVPCAGTCNFLAVSANNSNNWLFANMPTVVFTSTTQAMNAVLNATYPGTAPVAYGSLFARRIK